MRRGFFTRSELAVVRAPKPTLPRCGICRLHEGCTSPKMPVDGEGRRGILIVGEAPGEHEDARGKPFVGRTGEKLADVLRKLGCDVRRDCWLTNSLICRPPKNATPTDAQIDYCRPNVSRVIRELQPRVIILLGSVAVKSVIGALWKEDPGGIERWAGWRVPCQNPNAWICPTHHPARLLRDDHPVLHAQFERHLEEALNKKQRPWKQPPAWVSSVRCLFDHEQAAAAVRRLAARTEPVAFDYETDRIKPDHPDARILCCSVSDGRDTVAFPWHGQAIIAMKGLLRSNAPKISANLKFEDRWSSRLLGVRVKNWAWDTVVNAHIIDNRPAISGLKFQSFALLGQEDYDHHIAPYRKSKGQGGNSPNRLREVEMGLLLRYCGLDSLLEVKVAKIQARQLGIDLRAGREKEVTRLSNLEKQRG